MSQQEKSKTSKSKKHSPSDAQQKARTQANKARRQLRDQQRIDKQAQRTRRVKTAEQHRETYFAKQRNETAVLPQPQELSNIHRMIVAWRASVVRRKA